MIEPHSPPFKCSEECIYCNPRNGETNCPYFNEYLSEVEWVSASSLKEGRCYRFKGEEDVSLDEILELV